MIPNTHRHIDLSYLLGQYDERWVCTQPGRNTQICRRDALIAAKRELSSLPDNLAQLMAELTVIATEIITHRAHYEDYIRFQLKGFAIMGHIIMHDAPAITVIESSLSSCEEIQNFLRGHLVP